MCYGCSTDDANIFALLQWALDVTAASQWAVSCLLSVCSYLAGVLCIGFLANFGIFRSRFLYHNDGSWMCRVLCVLMAFSSAVESKILLAALRHKYDSARAVIMPWLRVHVRWRMCLIFRRVWSALQTLTLFLSLRFRFRLNFSCSKRGLWKKGGCVPEQGLWDNPL